MQRLTFGLSALLAWSTAAEAACSLATLQQAGQQYLSAVTSGKASNVNVASNVAYTENFKNANINTGILSKGAIKIALNRTLHDTVNCATYTEIIAPDNAKPYILGTQIHYDNSGKATKVDTLISSTGDWMFDAKKTLQYAQQEKRPVIAEAQRDTRQAIQAAADAYLDLFGDSKVKVPWGTPCERLEGSMHMTACNAGIISGGMKMTDRRYVIDESVGTVDVFLKFGGSMPDSHEFRLENGKLRYVHTITIMSGR